MAARGETVLGAQFTETRHLGLGLYMLASAGGVLGGRAFFDHCAWGPLSGYHDGELCWGPGSPWARTSFFTLVEITSERWFRNPNLYNVCQLHTFAKSQIT